MKSSLKNYLIYSSVVYCSGTLNCQLTAELCKFEPRCANSVVNIARVDNFLVTGTGSSGTTWLRQSLRNKGFDVADETWFIHIGGQQTLERAELNRSAGKDGMVSWPARCRYISSEHRRMLDESDDGFGNVLWTINTQRRFRVIVHWVRHPLKFTASNSFFSNHIQSCFSAEKNQVCELNWWRTQIWTYVFSFAPEIVPDTDDVNDIWNLDPLSLSVLHWYSWNLRLEMVSDLRVPLFEGDSYNTYSISPARFLCQWLMAQASKATIPWHWQGRIDCNAADAPSGMNTHRIMGHEFEAVTWDNIDEALRNQTQYDFQGQLISGQSIRQMALRYGFALE